LGFLVGGAYWGYKWNKGGEPYHVSFIGADWEVSREFVGFFGGALTAFLLSALVLGAALLIIEVEKSLRRIDMQLQKQLDTARTSRGGIKPVLNDTLSDLGANT
jgi:hypothetical protein